MKAFATNPEVARITIILIYTVGEAIVPLAFIVKLAFGKVPPKESVSVNVSIPGSVFHEVGPFTINIVPIGTPDIYTVKKSEGSSVRLLKFKYVNGVELKSMYITGWVFVVLLEFSGIV